MKLELASAIGVEGAGLNLTAPYLVASGCDEVKAALLAKDRAPLLLFQYRCGDVLADTACREG